MSNSTQMDRVLDGMLNFNAETKETLDSIKGTIDKIFDKRYQANHTPLAVMTFEDEVHYWEEQLCKKMLEIQHPEWSLEGQEVEAIQRDTYVIIRGNLKSDKTIRYDESKFNQLYINGERYTGDYTFNGETPETYERLVIVAVQTPFSLGHKIYGELDVLVADFPIENAEIFVNIGKFSELQPNIDELIVDETAEGFYVRGDWTWTCKDASFIKTLSITGNIIIGQEATFNVPAAVNFFTPNTAVVPKSVSRASILNIDISNCTDISGSAFSGSFIKGHLYINVKGSIGWGAFQNNQRITSLYIDDNTIKIDNSVFDACKNLREVHLGNGIASLGQDAFLNCSSLSSIHLGKSIISMGTATFNGCSSITEITVSAGYHCQNNYFRTPNALDWRCFLDILKNCAVYGEDGRTAEQMKFLVHVDVFNRYDQALNYSGNDEQMLADKEIAQQIKELSVAKNILITT